MAAVMDETQLCALRAQYGAPLLSLALRLTSGDRGHAEDLVQETLLRAWQHPEAFADGPALPWLFTVTRNLSVDAHRRRQHRPAEVSQELTHELGGNDDPDRLLDAQMIAAAVKRLSRPHRQVIVELFYRDRSVTETAAVLGIPPGTVKSRTFYALRVLRLALEEEPGRASPARPSATGG